MIPSEGERRQRLTEVARSWISLREEGGREDHYHYHQAQHWFHCLVWVTGFERGADEPLDAFLARAARVE